MDAQSFADKVNCISIGKKLPEAIYLHKETLAEIAPELSDFVCRIATAIKLSHENWSVIKLYKKAFRLSYLDYPSFFDDAYPPLKTSLTVDLNQKSVKESNYSDSNNPPILHRKELFITSTHSKYEEFETITKEGELAGLYDNTKIIGFKSSWERLIKSKGYMLLDGRLFRNDSFTASNITNSKGIDRHRTAISRNELSAPMKCLAKHGYLNGEYTIFDYGCGRGDDLLELEAHGIDAAGWDPNFRSESDKFNCDLVNIGFVINVIEDRDERIDALISAFQLSEKLLVVSAMLGSESFISKFKPFKDGVITSRNTFQKYYAQSELQTFIEQTTDENAIAVAPGIFYVFKDKLEEQGFLERRQRRNHRWKQLTSKPATRADRFESILNDNRDLFESFWKTCLSLGRLPAAEEFVRIEELKSLIGSPKKAFKMLEAHFNTEEFEDARESRIQDLSVYFALSFFNKRKAYSQLPPELQRDVKAFFGSHQQAKELGKYLLLQISKVEEINHACKVAHIEIPNSKFVESESLIIRANCIPKLPPILRVYINSALYLYGDLDKIDLVKVHIRSGKLTLLKYDSFFENKLPLLTERIKIRMRQLDVDFFSYGKEYALQPLYEKSMFISDAQEKEAQQRFEKKLLNILNIEPEMLTHSWPTLIELLNQKGYQLKANKFYKN
ncbi:hypothetical protein A3755_06605 [Oleiphilus sp. HI0085]|nr:hypothetical protein A3741_01595 [Oleiphilus sp. HI0069]KZZ34108.1 hypothetical protein A3755_06605 [Oleiphilus sp. HI0085]